MNNLMKLAILKEVIASAKLEGIEITEEEYEQLVKEILFGDEE